MMKIYKENTIPPSLSYKKTEAYSVLIKLNNDIQYCKKNINCLNKKSVNSYVRTIYGDYTIDKIIDLGINAYNRLFKKLMKVYAKVTLDIEREINEKENGKTIYYK